MNLPRRLPAALGLSLLAVPAATHGKPTPTKAPPTTKQTTPDGVVSLERTKRIATKHISAVKIAKPLTRKAKREVIASAGLSADAADIGEPVTVSVRDPRESNVTLGFVGVNMVLNNQGVAVIGQLNAMDSGDAPLPPDPSSSESQNCAFPPPLPCVPVPALPTGSSAMGHAFDGFGYVTLRFRAAPQTAYIVDCLASGETDVHSRITVAKAVVDEDATAADGQFEVFVGRGPRRDVRIDLFSEGPWTFRQCQVTPVR